MIFCKGYLRLIVSNCLILSVILLAGCGSLTALTSGKKGDNLPAKEVKSLPWEVYLKNKERSGATDDTIGHPLRSYWSYDITSIFNILPFYPMQNSSPAVVDDTAYIGSTDRIFYALDLQNRKALWKFNTTGAVESSPAVFSGRVYFGTNDGIFYCLDARNGKEIWRFNIRTEIISAPLIADGRVYFTSVDDRLYALDAATGEKVWHYSRTYVKGKMIKRQYASPAYFNSRIYMLFSDGYLVSLNALSGKEMWKKIIDEKSSVYSRSTPTIDGSMLYIINGERMLVVLDPENGNEKWRFDTTQTVDFAIKKNMVLLMHPEGQIFAVNKVTGETIWRRKVSNGKPVSAIVAGSYLIVASNHTSVPFDIELLATTSGYVDMFELNTGELVWTTDTYSAVATTPVAAYNKLLFANNKGKLYVYKGKE
ncbi:MAG: hypothetical protein A2073_02875 [Deltaproteobacteria bacterium GWC2_42_11]|nr:MAG: hypothetical protein A2073_02875 [Deltaproteobacteria bacterium GWC2_42_11]